MPTLPTMVSNTHQLTWEISMIEVYVVFTDRGMHSIYNTEKLAVERGRIIANELNVGWYVKTCKSLYSV